eukprot:5576712-Pleurochrysis_carterae.AAC.1
MRPTKPARTAIGSASSRSASGFKVRFSRTTRPLHTATRRLRPASPSTYLPSRRCRMVAARSSSMGGEGRARRQHARPFELPPLARPADQAEAAAASAHIPREMRDVRQPYAQMTVFTGGVNRPLRSHSL